MPYEKDPNEVGALWIKSGRKGEFLSGTINGEPVVCFRNDRKTGKQPDWRVLKSQPRGEQETAEPTRRHVPNDANAPDLTDDDIQF